MHCLLPHMARKVSAFHVRLRGLSPKFYDSAMKIFELHTPHKLNCKKSCMNVVLHEPK